MEGGEVQSDDGVRGDVLVEEVALVHDDEVTSAGAVDAGEEAVGGGLFLWARVVVLVDLDAEVAIHDVDEGCLAGTARGRDEEGLSRVVVEVVEDLDPPGAVHEEAPRRVRL